MNERQRGDTHNRIMSLKDRMDNMLEWQNEFPDLKKLVSETFQPLDAFESVDTPEQYIKSVEAYHSFLEKFDALKIVVERRRKAKQHKKQ